ncbi:RNA-binding protein [Histomonas meleagridis]|uniref:RNA-binding protein n=1 Tax=Histomonas meleagridis TaxID=135588 RepID=UPI00355993DF|nr:RNA-binding protein [Histomonas meleagridis]KAH0801937.1 RNA-binding protein [Histomonas meleagridis]
MDPKTVFVTNINFKAKQEELSNFFGKFGKVKATRILNERYRGQLVPRGIGFIEFENEDGMKAAIKAAEEAEAQKKPIQFLGRNLRIRQAKVRPERKMDAVFVGGIPEGATVDELKEAFKAFNPLDAKIIRYNKGEAFGFAFIKFSGPADQAKASKEGKIQFKGAESIVRPARRDYDAPRRISRRFRRGRRNFRRAPKQQNQ